MNDVNGVNWRAEDLWLALEPLCPGLSIEVLPETASTNAALLERARLGDPAPCLMVAERQTAGRGRMGRAWWSKQGDSLTFSVGLPYAPQDWSGLSLAVGVALADALEPQPGTEPRLGLKWPNDLWLRNNDPSDLSAHKLGGILIETLMLPHAQRWLVIGVGLNIAAQPTHLPDTPFNTGYAGLQSLDTALDAPTALHRLAAPLLQALQRFEHQGWAAFQARFAARDVLAGCIVQAGPSIQGRAAGTDHEGALLVHTASGIETIHSGEVSVRPC
ncbi:biotin--[acetyl-CoA-carboxylase] ligase [Leptothrix ochracea]|uniref:biotin--[acetyl-CoA-carboxylase] ligase n=1 Tax=Leptothrix ochracea TaxID=735331 RepID=UPI0034E2DA3B